MANADSITIEGSPSQSSLPQHLLDLSLSHPFEFLWKEVVEKEEGKNESHLTSVAAFLEGGIQVACDDSCSICLDDFCDSDPGTSRVIRGGRRITTLGSETSGGSVYVMNLKEPLEYGLEVAMLSRRIDEISRFKSTVWTADFNSNKHQVVIGTNIGAALAHIESGKKHGYVVPRGNNVLCGLRNGGIVTVDRRHKPQNL
ncbi:hypothetical protein L2E82_38344 [Cichorium intybus]|uniref:Uncharacterized protein n=1 Tax=Cichorium intybus TaxID=13427 RepID=A0ACB9AHK4_CICIN|nr:hypothetical protein L2E82_38344 [Cichorium intybus]